MYNELTFLILYYIHVDVLSIPITFNNKIKNCFSKKNILLQHALYINMKDYWCIKSIAYQFGTVLIFYKISKFRNLSTHTRILTFQNQNKKDTKSVFFYTLN